MGLGVLSMAPLTQWSIGTPEPHVILEVEGKTINFLLDSGATLSVQLCNPGTPSTRCVTI